VPLHSSPQHTITLTPELARHVAVIASHVPGQADEPRTVLHRVGLIQLDSLTRVDRAHRLTCLARLPRAARAREIDGHRGMETDESIDHAQEILAGLPCTHDGAPEAPVAEETEADHESLGTAWGAATSSFLFFASGAIIPVLPYLFGLGGFAAVLVAAVLVGAALLGTGAIVGVLSGASPLKRALRQLAIGFGAAGVTYLLGLLFGSGPA